MTDFTSELIELKDKGFFVEDMGSEYGPQFSGQYRWMNSITLDFQDGCTSNSEVDAWKACAAYNLK